MKNIIVSCILLLIVNQILLADGTPPEGSGTEEDPYLIANLDNLLYLSTNDYLWTEGYHFSQTDDIDASDTENWNIGDHDNDPDTPDEVKGFSPIGMFHGSYNGNEYIIENLLINLPGYFWVGLFGTIEEGNVENLGLININIIGGPYVGGFAGRNIFSTINNCYTSGTISSTWDIVGGIVGYNNESNISNCHNTANITGYDDVGGLVGLSNNSTINQCYSDAGIYGESYVGGLVGKTECYTIISNSYSRGNVDGEEHIGGLVGLFYVVSRVINCYSMGYVNGSNNVGGLVATGYFSYVNDSFWNTETSGQTSSYGGTGKTTAEMQDVATYTDLTTIGLDEPWDFVDNPFDDTAYEDIWDIDPDINNGYPYLTTLPLVGTEEELIPNSSLFIPHLSNHPNPFNPTTTISFSLTTELTENTEIYIYNVKGQQVDRLPVILSGVAGLGDRQYSVIWNAENLSSGIYFYQLKSDNKILSTQKAVLMK